MPRGRRPKPKSQLKLVGTFRSDRHGDSPDPPRTPAQLPTWLTGRALECWPEVAGVLARMGLDSSHYGVAMALLCDALADFIYFSELAGKQEPVSTSDNGNAFQSPIYGLKNKAWERVLKASREFGMTPAALRGIEMKKDSPIDELDEVLA